MLHVHEAMEPIVFTMSQGACSQRIVLMTFIQFITNFLLIELKKEVLRSLSFILDNVAIKRFRVAFNETLSKANSADTDSAINMRSNLLTVLPYVRLQRSTDGKIQAWRDRAIDFTRRALNDHDGVLVDNFQKKTIKVHQKPCASFNFDSMRRDEANNHVKRGNYWKAMTRFN